MWSKTYGGGQEDYFYDLVATADGGYLAGGSFNSTGFNSYTGEAWLIKTDANGNIQWQKKYTDNSNPGRIHGLTQTSDGGYALIGDFPFAPGVSDWMVIKTDANGNIQWQRRLGNSSSDDAIDIIEDNHGGAGLVMTGNNYSPTNYDADIVKFDLATGNLLWTRTYDFDGRTNRFNNISKVSDGFVITAVNHDGFFADNAVVMLLKTDFSGTIVLAREYRFPGVGIQGGHITVLPDGGYLMGLDDLPESANSDIHLLRADASGNIIWTKKYPRANAQIVNKLITDGNAVVGVGFTKAGSYNDVFLFKSDFSGKMGNCSSVDETGTTRTPTINPMSSPYTINTTLNLLSINSNSTGINLNVPTNVFCESCPTPLPTVSIANATINESSPSVLMQICISAVSTQPVTVQYHTVDGTATSEADYLASLLTVTIPAGQTCTTISIPIVNDAVSESTENFTVILSNATNATIGTGIATVTITDNDQPQFNCNNITINPGNNLVSVGGLTAPIVTVQIFNSNWATVFNQTYTDAPGTVNIPIGPGTYLAKVTFYTSNWSFICDKSQNVTVINQCPPGATCISNICPAQTVNLNNAYSISNLPAGTVVSWHTGTPATDANKMTPAQAQNVSVSGTYYAAIFISGANCYSATIPVNVTIISCSANTAITTSILEKTAADPSTRKIMVFPNPFTHSVRVIIDSEKKEKATLIFTDVLGRQLKTKAVQLLHGSNQFLIDGLEKYPSGNYFLSIRSSEGIKTFKVMRQQ